MYISRIITINFKNMSTNKNFISLAILIVGAMLVISGCSTAGSKENNPSPESPQQETESNNDDGKTVVYFFWADGCSHCAKQKPWLEELEEEHADLEVKMLETYNNQENARLFQEMARAYGIQARGVPATFIGDYNPIVGFSESMKPSIENKIETCLNEGCINPESKL